MSSFYGNGGGSGGGGSGTYNYNELINKPIISLEGNNLNIINLAELPEGNFIIKGSYKWDFQSEVKNFGSYRFVQVFMDDENKDKIVCYESVSKGTIKKVYLSIDPNSKEATELHASNSQEEWEDIDPVEGSFGWDDMSTPEDEGADWPGSGWGSITDSEGGQSDNEWGTI